MNTIPSISSINNHFVYLESTHLWNGHKRYQENIYGVLGIYQDRIFALGLKEEPYKWKHRASFSFEEFEQDIVTGLWKVQNRDYVDSMNDISGDFATPTFYDVQLFDWYCAMWDASKKKKSIELIC